MSKEYKVIVKEVLKFRDGTSEERTIVERTTSKQKPLEEILDDINEEAHAGQYYLEWPSNRVT